MTGAGEERLLAARRDLRGGDAAGVLRQVRVEAAAVGEQEAEHEHPDEARDAEGGERGHDPVKRPRRQEQTPISASTTIDPMNPGRPVIDPLESVNHEFACVKKCPPAPIPMITRGDLQIAQHERDLEGDDRTEAITSINASSHPRNGCPDAAREHVVAARARHHRRQRREDQRQQDENSPAMTAAHRTRRTGPSATPARTPASRRSGTASPDADERGHVEEQRVGNADVAHQS